MTPKKRRTTPPATPIAILIVDSFATGTRPLAKSRIRANSTMECAIENTNPLLAPNFTPWETVAKNRGPGAKAPEAVMRITVETNCSTSIKLESSKAR